MVVGGGGGGGVVSLAVGAQGQLLWLCLARGGGEVLPRSNVGLLVGET